MANRPGQPVRQLIGERFGMLLVVDAAGFAKGRALWRCICDCGATDIVAIGNLLQQGKKKSCGCASNAMMAAAKRTHGQAGAKRTSGVRNGRAKLTEEDVRFIRASKEKRSVLAEKFGLAPTYISSVRSGHYWQILGDEQRVNRPRAKLNEDDIRFIRASSANRQTLANMLDVSEAEISGIRTGRKWRSVE